MLTPAKMKDVEILILERDVDAVTECLGRLGLVQPKPVESHPALAGMDVSDRIEQWTHVESRCDALLRQLSESEPAAGGAGTVALADARGLTEQCEVKLAEYREQERELEKKEAALRQAREGFVAYEPIPTDVATLDDRSFLHFAVGSMGSNAVERLAKGRDESEILIPFRTDEGEEKLIAISTRKGRWSLEGDLEAAGFIKEEAKAGQKGVAREILARIDAELAEIADAHRRIEDEQGKFCDERIPLLQDTLAQAQHAQTFYRAQANFARTERMCLISGWTRVEAIQEVEQALSDATDGRVLIEYAEPPPGADVPVCMQNPKLLKPFERLIAAYGMPGYHEVEPTLFVALSFLLMFGFMFGDMGQGAVIALTGLAMLKVPSLARKHGDTGVILIGAGLSAMLFGALYGSLFSYEFHYGLEPLHHIPHLLIGSVIVGVVIISLGVILNVVNCVRKGDYLHALFDKFGVAGIVLYWGCIGLLIKQLVLSDEPVTTAEIAVVVGIPLVLMIFRLPIFNLVTRKKHLFGEGVVLYFMETMVELIETFSSFLGSSVSFLRLTAYGLAHAVLSMGIFILARVVWDMPVGGLLAALVVVAGNALIIVLEGLIVTVQTMRLEYYEFFSKFFTGEGKRFEPFRIAG